jgi:hypothetical protein
MPCVGRPDIVVVQRRFGSGNIALLTVGTHNFDGTLEGLDFPWYGFEGCNSLDQFRMIILDTCLDGLGQSFPVLCNLNQRRLGSGDVAALTGGAERLDGGSQSLYFLLYGGGLATSWRHGLPSGTVTVEGL